MPARAALPARRMNETREVIWQGKAIAVTVGFYPGTGAPGEVFADAAAGGHLQATLADACVLVSIALQYGVTPEALAKSLGRVPNLLFRPDDPDCDQPPDLPASPVGAVIEALL